MDMQPDGSSVAMCLAALHDQVASLSPDQLVSELLRLLPHVKTAADVHDWLGELTADLCEACPDLLMQMSERLALLMAGLAPEKAAACVTHCLNAAWASQQSSGVLLNLCSRLHGLPLPAMQALLTCLHGQRACGQLPEDESPLIDYVQSVIDGMSKTLPALGFCANTLVIPIENTKVALQDDEIAVIDTGTERHAIRAPGAATDDGPMELPRDMVTLVLTHILQILDMDWMRPEFEGPPEEGRKELANWALVDKAFFTRLAPMLTNLTWMQSESDIRRGFVKEDTANVAFRMDTLVHCLVDLKAQDVRSILPRAPGVAERRLDLVLWTFMVSLAISMDQSEELKSGYLKLHNRAVLQLASQRQAMSPYFAEHVDLSALPLQFLTMAYRMRGLMAPDVQDLAVLVAYSLPEYPADVQAQTLISLLSMLPDPSSKAKIMARLHDLMGKLDLWPTPPRALLRCQWSNLDGMLALLEDPGTVLEYAAMADALLLALQEHHGVSDEPSLLSENPFDKRRVLWTIADIRLLAALCKRSAASGEWKPPGLVGCLAALLRQFCSVSAPPYTFAATEFKAEFPRGILDSAVLLLTPREQELIADERPEIVLRKTHLPS